MKGMEGQAKSKQITRRERKVKDEKRERERRKGGERALVKVLINKRNECQNF